LPKYARWSSCVLAAVVLTAVVAAPAVAAPALASLTAGNPAARSATVATSSATAASPGSIGLRLVDIPVSTRNDPRAQLYIVDHLAPGTVIHRRIEVSNTTARATRVLLYAAAAGISKGSFLGAAGHTRNDLSTWTSLSPGAPIVPAGGRVMATVTIAVPRDAAPGEQYGAVWAEVGSPPIASSAVAGSARGTAVGGVTKVNRVGIRLYVSVGPGGAPAADFTIPSLTAERSPDGRPMVLARVRNTGGRALDMNGELRLLGGPGGQSAGPFPATLGTSMAIGDTQNVSIALDKRLPNGPWDARITLRSGLLERSAQATITFPNTGAAESVDTNSIRPGWLYPLIAGILIALLLIIATLLVLLSRNRRHQVEEKYAAQA